MCFLYLLFVFIKHDFFLTGCNHTDLNAACTEDAPLAAAKPEVLIVDDTRAAAEEQSTSTSSTTSAVTT